MKTLAIILTLLPLAITPGNPVKDIIGQGLTPHHELYISGPTNRHDHQTWYFYANVTPADSITVIHHEQTGDLESYAFIIHDTNSRAHATFTAPHIRAWHDRRPATVLDVTPHRDIDPRLLRHLAGYWVPVHLYRGRYHLHQDWACVIARQLTDSTWVQIDMETTARGIRALRGTPARFTIELANGTVHHFQLIDPRREIYRVGNSHWIPVRRVRAFPLIAYCSTDGIPSPIPLDH